MRTKQGLTLGLPLYLAEVQGTLMLTYVLLMVEVKCPFPQFADGLENIMQPGDLL